ncbi:MAG: glycoside hydrolase family 13 domain protein [Gemmatimonadetes bacterium]|nr:glycoside hydrolase family 13 domain protein [Gemmatimonadota bacterium]
MEMIVEELQRPVVLDASFERRVMVRVRRFHAQNRARRGKLARVAASITHHPAWTAAIAASLVAVTTFGIMNGRLRTPAVSGAAIEPTRFVLVAPTAQSVSVVGDFNNWGLGDSALVATSNHGVWSVTAQVPAGVHRYAFVVNGKDWRADPTAPRSPGDDFGMPSSALVVEEGSK